MIDLKVKKTYDKVRVSMIESSFFITDNYSSFIFMRDMIIENCQVEPDSDGGLILSGMARHYEYIGDWLTDYTVSDLEFIIKNNPDFIDDSEIYNRVVEGRKKWYQFWLPKEEKIYTVFDAGWVLLKKRKEVRIHLNSQGRIVTYEGFEPRGFSDDYKDFFSMPKYKTPRQWNGREKGI